MEYVKESYLVWHEYYSVLPKVHRYTVGEKIDTLFIEIMEAVSGAAFLSGSEKLPWVRSAARKLDTLKLLLLILWESGSLLDKKYIALPTKVDTGARCSAAGRDNCKNKTPPKPLSGRGRNEESCEDGEREQAVVIPLVVRLVPVGVQPPTVVVAVRVEDARIAARSVRGAIHATTP